MNFNRKAIFIIIAILLQCCKQTERKSLCPITPVDFSKIKIDDSFWAPRLAGHATTTLAVCIDQIENQTGRIRNFECAAADSGSHSGIYFDDSDVYKAIEGIAYTLTNNPNPALEQKADEWIDKISAAQEEDGYLNTYFSLTNIDNRWHDMDYHEMYCAGHLFEAAVAYYKATGKRKLLDVAIRLADHLMSEFGPDKRHWVTGHEEVELALVRLADVTGNRQYIDFARWLLEERGHGHGHNEICGWAWDPVYHQDDKPVADMTDIGGHAVRAMYLYCGMADVAAATRDTNYFNALNRLWDDVVRRNMYITGGIGSSGRNEGFTNDYDLPNFDAYCETCASVGMVLWNWRMNQATGDSRYIDVLERSMYNGALAGISLTGDKFFYVNPLASHGKHHRQAWYGCACCPSQISRFLPSIGNYIYGVSDEAIWINLFIGNTARFEIEKGNEISLKMETDYPWDGKVRLQITDIDKPVERTLRIRIPGWARHWTIDTHSDKQHTIIVEKGYAIIEKKWEKDDVIDLIYSMPVEIITDNPLVSENAGKSAICRGPLVYCAEEVDNKKFNNVFITPKTKFESSFEPSLLGGVSKIKATTGRNEITFIPYYAWDNRKEGEMRVWIDFRK